MNKLPVKPTLASVKLQVYDTAAQLEKFEVTDPVTVACELHMRALSQCLDEQHQAKTLDTVARSHTSRGRK